MSEQSQDDIKKIEPTKAIDESELLKAYNLLEQIYPNIKLKGNTPILCFRRQFL